MFIIRFLSERDYVVGPFKTADAAQKYIEKESLGGGAVIQKLTAPYYGK